MIQIFFTSPADILPDEAKRLGAIVLPVEVNFGTDIYKDGIDLTHDEFFEKMKDFAAKTNKLPQTSQITEQVHIDAFKPYLDKGDEIFYVSMSSGLSSTIDRVNEAVKTLGAEDKITVFDSEVISFPYAALVREAVKVRDNGMNRADLLKHLTDCRDRLELLAFVSDITYLKKGGRLRGAQAVVATALNIKPLITIRDLKVDAVGKAIGINGACKKIAKMYSEYKIDKNMPVYMGHSNSPDLVEKITKQIKSVDPSFKASEVAVGAAVGTHVGPGCCGIAFFRQKGTPSLIKK